MKRPFLTLLSACCLLGAEARVMTLDQCIDYALEHNLTVKRSDLDRRNAELELRGAKDAVLPQLSGSASQNWNFGQSLTSANTYANRNTSSFGVDVGLQVPLFNGLQTVRNISYTKASLTAAIEELEAAKENVELQVMAQYLQALYCGELETVAESQAKLTADEVERRRALLEAGKIPEADMLDAASQAAQADMQLVSARHDHSMALLDLAQLLRLPEPDEFDVVPLDSLQSDPLIREPRQVYESALLSNHGIAANRMRVKVAERGIDLARSGWIPRLSFNAGLGSKYSLISGMDNESFGRQMKHNFNQFVGFSLSVPIFDAFTTRNNVSRAKLQRLSADLNLETQQDNLFKTVTQTYQQAIGARRQLGAAEAACTASAAALAAVQEKYNQGRATPTDFDTARNAYIRSLSERARARYELILRARILDFYARR